MSLKYHIAINPDAENNAHAKLIRMTGRSRRVLELGCHAGDVSRLLAERGCRVRGVEIDPQAAKLAEQFCEKVMVADLDTLDPDQAFAGERFDVITMGDVLEHLAAPLKALKMARGLLAPGGCVIISVPNIAHVSVRLGLLGGGFLSDPSGLMDRTHRRFFTRASLARLLSEAGLFAQVWDQVSAPWSQDKIKEELRLMGVPASPELLALLGSAEATAYQYVVKAVPVPAQAPGLTVVLLCPQGLADLERIKRWSELAGPAAALAVVAPASWLERSNPQLLDLPANARIIGFGAERHFGQALLDALPSPLTGRVMIVHANIRPSPELVSGLAACLDEQGSDNAAGVFAAVEPGPGLGRSWWMQAAKPPTRRKDLGIEFCQGLALCAPASFFAESAFAQDLPFPWVLADWTWRAHERGFVFARAQGVKAESDFVPSIAALSSCYRYYGRLLQEQQSQRPAFTQRFLPARPSRGKRLRQIPRRLALLLASGRGDHDKYFMRLRALCLQKGFFENRDKCR